MNYYNQKYSFSFILLFLITCTTSYFLHNNIIQENIISLLTFKDAFLIFIMNFITFNILILFSFTGASFIGIFSFFISFSISNKSVETPTIMFYILSLSHAIIEIYVYYIIYVLSWNIIGKYREKRFGNELNNVLRSFFKHHYLKCIGLLILGSACEVFISNRLINFIKEEVFFNFMDIYGFLLLCFLVVIVLYIQIRSINRIIIREKIDVHIRVIYYLLGISFLIFGIFITTEIYQMGLFIGILIIFFLSPQMTGLGKKYYFYKSKITGLGGLAVKKQSYNDVLQYKSYIKDENLYIVFKHDFFINELKFSVSDKDKIERIIGPYKK